MLLKVTEASREEPGTQGFIYCLSTSLTSSLNASSPDLLRTCSTCSRRITTGSVSPSTTAMHSLRYSRFYSRLFTLGRRRLDPRAAVPPLDVFKPIAFKTSLTSERFITQ